MAIGKTQIPLLLLGASFSASLQAAVNDLLPGDFSRPVKTFSFASVYLYERSSELVTNPSARQQTGIRTVVLGHARNEGTVLPHSISVSASQLGVASNYGATRLRDGIGDAKLSITVWPWSNDSWDQAIGLSHVFPTGDYDPKFTWNPGQNRHRSALTISGAYRSDNIRLEQSVEFGQYQDNTRHGTSFSTLSQTNTVASTSYLTVAAPQGWSCFVGYYLSRGGTLRVDDIATGVDSAVSRGALGVRFLAFGTGVTIRMVTDLERRSGSRLTREILLRAGVTF